ncbi:MAG: tetratricopeptide repeat protein [Deltaproteobacteria bacterium]|nr:tetratricopeptide repeat protein [Deltaproteobacteria bacterium]MBW2537581.1 tetratricopeptide repeat protein [Deltaproteobacteria bacterium]
MTAREDRDKPSPDDEPEDRSEDSQEELDDEESFDDDEDDEDDEDEEDDGEDEEDRDGDPDEEHADARAGQVAKALGLGDQEEEAEEEKAESPKNRAARRRQQRERRRGGRRREAASDDADSPQRDRNKRLREQLLKRRREAASSQAQAAQGQGLAPSEMAEDVLVRASASATKWLMRNKALVGWTVFAAVAITAGGLYWIHRTDTTRADASDLLSRAVAADQALLLSEEEDTRTDEQKEYDVRKFYPSVAERSKAALEGYQLVADEHAGSGAAILAALGRGGALLDNGKPDEAIQAFDAVLATELAPVDDDVRARALEGLGFAKEAKGDLDGAIAAFQKLESVAGFEPLGKYHRARVLTAKKAPEEEIKSLLSEARKAAEKANTEARSAGGDPGHRWELEQIENALRAIDPNAVPPQAPSMPGQGPDMEKLRQMLESRGLSTPQLPPPGGGAK